MKLLKPLPCPFCGSEPVIGPSNPELSGNAFGFVECPAKPHVGDGEIVADDRGSRAYINVAIKR